MSNTPYQQLLEPQKLTWYLHYLMNNEHLIREVDPSYFKIGVKSSLLSDTFTLIKDHYDKYKKVPTKEDIKQGLRLIYTREEAPDEVLTSMLNPERTQGISQEWLGEIFLKWLTYVKAHTIVQKATIKLKMNDGEDLIDEMQTIFKGLSKPQTDVSLRDIFDIDSYDFIKQERFTSGYKFINDCLGGGFWPGSLISFLAGPKVGKSGWMINLAKSAVLSGKNIAFISLELTEEMVFQRFMSSCLNMPIQQLSEMIDNDRESFNSLINDFKDDHPNKGTIAIKQLPTSRATVPALENLLLRAEEEFNVHWDLVVIDYFNLLSGQGENSYMKVKNIVENLRGMAMENKWAVVSPTQANRDGAKSENLQLSNISESINVAATVDVLFALEVNDKLRSEGKQRVRCLLSRVSGKQEYYQDYVVNWNTMVVTDSLSDVERSGSSIDTSITDALDQIISTSIDLNKK